MRRLFILFMLVLLPLQWSWAAAATVCQHETGSAHFGHHEHRHDADQAGHPAADGKSDAPSLNFHADCQVCHGMGAAHGPADADTGPHGVPDRHLSAYGQHLPEPPPENLLRPPLTLVA